MQQQQSPHQNHLQQHPQYVMNPLQMQQFSPTAPISTEYIQKRLDENKQLILAVLDNQNLGKLAECAQYQAQLQRNLLQLASIADSQPQVSAVNPQMLPGVSMQQNFPFVQQQPVGFPPQMSMQFSTQLYSEQQPQPLQHQPQPSSIQNLANSQYDPNNGPLLKSPAEVPLATMHAEEATLGVSSGLPSVANRSEVAHESCPSSTVDLQASKEDASSPIIPASKEGNRDSSVQ